MKGTGNLTFFSSNADDLSFEDIDFEFQPGDRSITAGADGSLSMVKRAGLISFRLEPFPGWQSIYAVTVTFPNGRNSENLFEVTRNFKQPFAHDGWLNYPVMQKQASPMKD
ncbi:hypothetical protein FH041_07110 [Pseudomonas sp. SWI7]|jgi:hypothetical protein|uniref:hypothetical protein n=1 Tax=Pseudomonas sp. SWI7 TaxID=2587597 RepID=UPI0011244532|nr:hypothetical protein [Pseudomonas sp. SWI7]QDC04708.1 hypothetical protein FH041_07110 [Pseudomonas sp. SWI7]